MEKIIYYIDGELKNEIGVKAENKQDEGDKLSPLAVLMNVYPRPLSERGAVRSVTDDNNQEADDGAYLVIEGSLLPEANSWDCFIFSYPCNLRCTLISRVDPAKEELMNTVMERLSAEYDIMLEEVERRIRNSLTDNTSAVAVMKNLSFGDFCVLYPSGKYSYDHICYTVDSIFASLGHENSRDNSLDTPDNEIETYSQKIKKRFADSYLVKRNSNHNEYKVLLDKMVCAKVGSNDRKMYMLLLCALLLRTILDESAARWVYESGDLKCESVENAPELASAYDLRKSSFDVFLEQASAASPYSDQIWSLFFITKTLLASIVGRSMKDAVSKKDIANLERDDEEVKRNRVETYNNFFGFVPYIGTRYAEVMSYYPSHLAPDYCYGFMSIPWDERFKLWSYFPAYVHEFFHYIPPQGRKERNEKILHLAVYSVMNPLYAEMTESRRTEYEKIVANIAEIIDNYRHGLIDIRNDYVIEKGNPSLVNNQNVENYRDTMKYNAIMHDLVRILDFEKICTKALENYQFKSLPDGELKRILAQAEWKQECLERWDEDMTSYLATYSFAMREIRSDLSMCVLLDIGLEEYIELLANEPAFAESSGTWVADSTVLRFGFITRLLYVKEQMGYSKWADVVWDDLCNQMLQTTCGQLQHNSYEKHPRYENTVNGWKNYCKKVIDETEPTTSKAESFVDYLANLKEYLESYQSILCAKNSEWYAVFERALCTAEYSIQAKEGVSRSLISNWGKQLSTFSKYSFANQLYSLYTKYKGLDNDIERYRFEYMSRLLFRDLLMVFPNIDLDRS